MRSVLKISRELCRKNSTQRLLFRIFRIAFRRTDVRKSRVLYARCASRVPTQIVTVYFRMLLENRFLMRRFSRYKIQRVHDLSSFAHFSLRSSFIGYQLMAQSSPASVLRLSDTTRHAGGRKLRSKWKESCIDGQSSWRAEFFRDRSSFCAQRVARSMP